MHWIFNISAFSGLRHFGFSRKDSVLYLFNSLLMLKKESLDSCGISSKNTINVTFTMWFFILHPVGICK